MTSASIASTTAYTGPPFDNQAHFGTSWAAPQVAGVAAIYLAANPNANVSQVVSAIISNATVDALQFPLTVSQFGPPSPAVGPNRLLYSDFQTDIQTTASSSNSAPAAGSQFTYTFQVKNNGPFNSMDPVIFTDNLPGNLKLVSAATNLGSCSTALNINCNLGRLAVGAQATIIVTVTAPPAAQSFTNTGTATLQSGQTDRALANNTASLTLTSR